MFVQVGRKIDVAYSTKGATYPKLDYLAKNVPSCPSSKSPQHGAKPSWEPAKQEAERWKYLEGTGRVYLKDKERNKHTFHD